jgi:hypothetical protein
MKTRIVMTAGCAVVFLLALAGCASQKSDIPTAVQVAAAKDCGCGHCAAKGCEPCHGKNCYYCVAKSLVTHECGCGMCAAKGCDMCGPGCDVCKFHLAPVAGVKDKPKP